jgi:dihydrofolate synthase/folylpolyglutamate synthase
MNTLPECLAWLEQRSGQFVKLGLESMQQALNVLSWPKLAPRVVIVGGTNGKGTTVGLITALCIGLGYRVGTYTSPHLVCFNERIALQGQPVSDEHLVSAFRQLRPLTDQIDLTYFEFITLVAGLIFIEADLDCVILEVGLGGRLDAVNVFARDLAVITNVDFDHQAILGSTLEEIGREKSGIIAHGKPVLLGAEVLPATVLAVAHTQASVCYQYGVDYGIDPACQYWFPRYLPASVEVASPPGVDPNNLATALTATALIGGFEALNRPEVQETLHTVQIPARCQWWGAGRRVLLDVSHNPQSIEKLARFVSQTKPSGRVLAVCGMLKDKDIHTALQYMIPCVDQWYLANVECLRGAPAELLSKILDHFSVFNQECYNSPCEAFLRAQRDKQLEDCIVVFGSFYTVGPIYHSLLNSTHADIEQA